jgi:hypothetical protein
VGKHTHHARPELEHRRDEPADGGAPAGDSAQTHASLMGNVASSWGPVLNPQQHAGASTYRFTRRCRADAGGRVRFRSSVARGRRRAVRALGLDSPAGARVGGTTGVTIAFRGSAVCVFQWRFGMPAAGTYDPRDFFRSGSVTPTHLRQEPIVTSAVCNFDSADVLGGCGASGGERDAPV